MSVQESSGGDSSDAAQQTDRAAEQTDRVDSYSPEYPEDPEAATPADNAHASEPPKSD